MKKILVFAGTRPEAIKMIPIDSALRKKSGVTVKLVAAGQHKEMLFQAFENFGVAPDLSLDVMAAGQTLASLSARLFSEIDKLLEIEAPDSVLVQGDTTTVQVAALCAFYRRIPVGHVEAGLRSGDMLSPFPEELNRRVVALIAAWHFAPTKRAAENLLAEGVKKSAILVSGNTVVDALQLMHGRVLADPPLLPPELTAKVNASHRIILVTGHRRESFGDGFRHICEALIELADKFEDIWIVYPVHLNPNVQDTVRRMLSGHPRITLTSPLSYKPFVYLMGKSHLILSDSGGIQEEGPSLGKPVLVMRDVTERPEGVEAGVNMLVGTSREKIVGEASRLLSDKAAYNNMASRKNPYGDGRAGEYIAEFLARRFLAPGSGNQH
jgi:UDP-N-acetylglucosamine 2-epimerase